MTAAAVDAAAAAAGAAFDVFRETSPAERAAFLERIAAELDDRREAIVDRACAESGLPRARIEGEHGRTTGQIRLFAREVRLGSHQGVRIDEAQPDRAPPAGAGRAPAPHRGGSGGGVRSQQLPAGVLGHRRRHRLGAGRGLPCDRQGPQRPSGHGRTGRVGGGRRGRGVRAARRGVLAAVRGGPGGGPGPGRPSGHQGHRLHRLAGGRHLADGHRGGPARADPGVRRDVEHQPPGGAGRGRGRRSGGLRRGLCRVADAGRGPVLHQPGVAVRARTSQQAGGGHRRGRGRPDRPGNADRRNPRGLPRGTGKAVGRRCGPGVLRPGR